MPMRSALRKGKELQSDNPEQPAVTQSIHAFLSTVNAEHSGLENPDDFIFCPCLHVQRRDFFAVFVEQDAAGCGSIRKSCG